MKYRWLHAQPQPLLADQLAGALKISPLLAQCLLNRGFSEPAAIRDYLQPRLKDLADPFLLPNMRAAVDRLFQARERTESVVIFGDYDVDGVTSTAILTEVLRALGWTVSHFLPHRLDDGYGLTREGAGKCLNESRVSLLLAVDCGSTAVATIDWLRTKGVDVIVLDHHQVSNPAPAAVALVNPQLSNPPAFHELCSAGLAFKLAHALIKHGRDLNLEAASNFDLRPLLDLVALGTIADLVPLTGENRILTTAGLDRLRVTSRPGLVALKQVARTPDVVGTYEVGFELAPRLNAAGRLETAAEALSLVQAPDLATATPIAQSLDARNRERQKIERGIAEEVLGDLRNRFDPKSHFVIVEGRLMWHVGVVGIVASRVVQKFYRPTIIIGGEGDEWRGSGRSIAGFDLAAALRQCDDLLVRHGGHALAAGLSIAPNKLDAFRERLNDIARRTLQPDHLQPTLRVDADVPLPDMSLDRIAELDRMKPLGQGNPSLQFVARNLTQSKPLQRMGADKRHVKLWVTDGRATREAVWWNAGAESALPVGRFNLAFSPQINAFNGRRDVQLRVLDWQPV